MKIDVQHNDFRKQRLSVETAGMFRGPKLLLNGELLPKTTRYKVMSDAGVEITISLIYNFLDPIPEIKIGEDLVSFAAPLKWYDRAYSGTNDHDIVSAINAAIGVLQGKPAPAPFSIRNPREAVFLLAHLIGDIHQPLHAGAVYLDGAGNPIDPDFPGEPFDPKTSTRGGNFIAVGSISLHAFWDEIPSSIKPDRITERMLTNAKAIGKTSGPVGAWSTTWATETLNVSKPVFEGLTYVPDPNKPGRWVAEFTDRKAYLKAKNRIDREQLAKAGARLAQVLNEVWG